jgi:hypothetical protein
MTHPIPHPSRNLGIARIRQRRLAIFRALSNAREVLANPSDYTEQVKSDACAVLACWGSTDERVMVGAGNKNR